MSIPQPSSWPVHECVQTGVGAWLERKALSADWCGGVAGEEGSKCMSRICADWCGGVAEEEGSKCMSRICADWCGGVAGEEGSKCMSGVCVLSSHAPPTPVS